MAIQSGSKILVSGASGFIAVHTIQAAIAKGLKVVGTVRSAEKGDWLKQNVFKSDFEYEIVKDIGAEGAFDEVLKKHSDVHGFLHTASPFHSKSSSPEELTVPAVNGTKNALNSAKSFGSKIERIVVTSSVAAVSIPGTKAPKTWTEKDWNTKSKEDIKKTDPAPSGMTIYLASKTLAEEAAWEFMKSEKPAFDLATINPVLVFGPVLQQCDKPEDLNTSVAMFYSLLKNEKTAEELASPGGNAVDVRDVAEAHVEALLRPEAGGERFILSVGPYCNAQFTEELNKIDPSLKLPKLEASKIAEANDPQKVTVSSGEKATKVLGIKYYTVEESAKAMYESIKARGW